ncbi:MAG: tetratricopeptide repeat protein [Bacteroidales bacterium]
MKKTILFLSAVLVASTAAFAQESIVDEVKKDISGYAPDYAAARTKILPTLENEETKNDAYAWFTAGSLEFGYYDSQLGKKQIGQTTDDAAMGKALVDGYNYYVKALSMDTIVQTNKDGSAKLNKDGSVKVKTKYSNSIVGTISGHVNDFNQAGNLLYGAKDFGGAYEAWEIYSTLPKAEFLGKYKPEIADTVIAETCFFKGIAAWQNNDDYTNAVKSFNEAIESGYKSKDVFDYAMTCYANMGDNDGIVLMAKLGYDALGSKDNQFVSILINNYINKEDYENATKLLDEAIAEDPTNAEYYNVQGSLYENQGDVEKAFISFQKSIEVNPEYAKGQFDVGRYYFNKAVSKRDEINELTGAAYQTAINEELNPLYHQALPHLEKALELDEDNIDAKNALRNIYYFLNDEEKLNKLERGY